MYKSLFKNSSINNFFYLIVLFLTIGIYSGRTSFLLCLIFIVLRLLTTNKETAGVFLILFGGVLGGATRIVYPSIPIYGLIVLLVGVLLLWRQIIPFLKRNVKGIVFLSFVFLVFFVAYIYGPQSSYSNRKLLEIVYKGLLLLFAYSVFNSSPKISNTAISQALVFTIIAYFVIGIHEFGFSRPISFLDYEWYRYNSVLIRDQYTTGISYQSLGMNGLYAFTFLLSQNRNLRKSSSFLVILFYIVCIHLILSSGARQAIFGVLAIFLLYVFYFRKTNSNFKRVSYVFLGILIVYFGINFIINLDISFISKSLNPNDGDFLDATGRGPIYITASNIIKQYPLFGVGLGGFSEFGKELYPHNFLLEILTETGLWGFITLSTIIIIYFKSYKISLKHETANGTFFFIILACVFIRAFFSSDLTESIGLISGVMALRRTKYYRKNNSMSPLR